MSKGVCKILQFFQIFSFIPINFNTMQIKKAIIFYGIGIQIVYVALCILEAFSNIMTRLFIDQTIASIQMTSYISSMLISQISSWYYASSHCLIMLKFEKIEHELLNYQNYDSYNNKLIKIGFILIIITVSAGLSSFGLLQFLHFKNLKFAIIFVSATFQSFKITEMIIILAYYKKLMNRIVKSLSNIMENPFQSDNTEQHLQKVITLVQTSDVLLDHINFYESLHNVYLLINKCYQHPIFFQIIMGFMTLVTQIYYIIFYKFGTIELAVMTFWILLIAVQMFTIILNISAVKSKLKYVLLLIGSIKSSDPRLQHEVDISYLKFCTRDTDFSCLGIDIEMQLLYTIVATVATYTMILIQFTPPKGRHSMATSNSNYSTGGMLNEELSPATFHITRKY